MASQYTPYRDCQPYSFWRKAMLETSANKIDPVVNFPFKINRTDKIATAGSCFAQHISRHLRKSGYNYLTTEKAHPILGEAIAREFNYETFTARYGNIYTSRQLLQLFQRAYGQFNPIESYWKKEPDQFIDPFRPNIQPVGFATLEELEFDRRQHFAAIREAFESLDVFIFTLGLTETWKNESDGAVYPLCPGVNGGVYEDSTYAFLNLSLEETIADLNEFVDLLKSVNPTSKVILTVSPVPLMATAEDRHVWVSTTLSKATLRLAAETVSSCRENIAYFPSYEIVTSPASRGKYYAENLRDVRETGVAHVMNIFFKQVADEAPSKAGIVSDTDNSPTENSFESLERIVEAICDEEMLDLQAP